MLAETELKLACQHSENCMQTKPFSGEICTCESHFKVGFLPAKQDVQMQLSTVKIMTNIIAGEDVSLRSM